VAELNELLEPYTEEEIYNEAVITILKMASRYTSHGGPRFHLYIDRCFSLYFKRQIENLIKDPLLHECCHYNDSLLLKDTIDEETIIDDVDYGACLQTDSLTFGDTDRFGANWVSGLTTDRAFKSLTPLDRKILIHHYIDGHTDKETAESIGYGARETVTRRRNQAKRRVEEYGQVYKLLNV
jgi:DNA-directed RNA polymerase specialized sigma24 family protein